ncbi:MAG TPA: DUF1998 domain-containing protein, partial [bacterium]|nr:DUF1998 domain-containing protein [bacterium]
HDQYFFKRPERMVAGAVSTPRLDLANEDLIRAHMHAIWLAETGQSLESSLKDILDLSGEKPRLSLKDYVQESMESSAARDRARVRAKRVLESILPEIQTSDWYTDGWLDEVLSQVTHNFDLACDRWRGLYRAAHTQSEKQHRIILDASRSAEDKKQAKRLRAEAEAQLDLLTESKNVMQSDFYSYRYFASEGFLPGYNFPRLPLSAYVPGRRRGSRRDEFLSRARFLAISEFGPRAFVYHEGSRYIINKAILPVGDTDVLITSAKLCPSCGYLHPSIAGEGVDLCERCQVPLEQPLRALFRLQNVSTRRRDRITSDEEERMRLGYELKTGVRFAEFGGHPSRRIAKVRRDEDSLATLTYGHAATLWRINLGWARRRNKNQLGFILDVERGYWAKNEQADEDDVDDPISPQKKRVIPYVEDRRNALLLEPNTRVDEKVKASLQAALKAAIQAQYELEDYELAAEPLPNRDDRRLLLFYEASEGGAGVLRRLVDDRNALAEVAREALRLCHFNPDTGEDVRRAPHTREDCEAACYDCLMNYGNQMDHDILDRKSIRDLLLQLASASVEVSPSGSPRAEHLERLMRLAGSELEREWLRYLEDRGYRLPTKAQMFIEECTTRPDFFYQESQTAIYIDGPIHDYPDRHQRDITQQECMENHGYMVIRFSHSDDWDTIIARHPNIFGR